ncbi:uncharacterized protein LOC120990052 [Bufo bufo]|uniref:uncharacterized protein LOC120990052 n=1 Tax=Bufo bufo TaxID=8384 RepID=UPI001ABE9C07|nr:uncharacterized protein LOC120990052 [Bufo bufo]
MQHQGWSGSGPPKKRPYMFKEKLMFLREVMELRPTENNLEEEGDESAPQQSSASEEDTPSGPAWMESGPGPTTAPFRPPAASGGDSQVLEYLSRARQEYHLDLFAHSLAHYLRRLPLERLLRTKSALGIVLDAATPSNDPTEMFVALDNWCLHGNMFVPRAMPISQGSQAIWPTVSGGIFLWAANPLLLTTWPITVLRPPFPTSLLWPAVSGSPLAI